MLYKIIYDSKNRLRVRFGKRIFSKYDAMGLRDYINSLDFVKFAEVTFVNGGILIYYHDGSKNKVINFLNSLCKSKIKELAYTPDDNVVKLETEFKQNISALILKKIIYPLILPMSIRKIIIFFRSLKFIAKGASSLLNARLDVNVLDAASITTAIITGEYTAANNVMFLLNISELFEDYTVRSAKLQLAKSLEINVDYVWALEGEEVVKKSLSQINAGDTVLVNAGNIIPIDGTVVGKEGFVNESAMTGESLPVMKKQGSTVFAGSVIEEGSLKIKVRGVDKQTRISKILRLIEDSQELKSDMQKNAQNIADGMVKYSLLTFFLVYLFTRDLARAVSVLMIDYSCAIRLSSSISVISAVKQAANDNIVVKGGKFLEEFANADTIVFDKTGTLTHASPHLSDIITFDGYDKDKALKIAACLEEHFPHSIARSIVKAAEEKNIVHSEMHTHVNYIVAHGLSSSINGKKALIGSRHFLEDDEKILLTQKQREIVNAKCLDCSTLFLSIDGKITSVFCIDDPPREEAADVIAELKKLGFKNIIMLTGDNEKTAQSVADKIGITKYYANVLPDEKFKLINSLKESGNKTAMVGDGINDAPALSAANVSIAMKDSSDIAREVSDITLLSSNLNDLIKLRKLSKELFKKINRTYASIVAFNSILIALGMLDLLSPSMAALLHNSSTTGFCIISSQKIEIDKN